MLTIGDFFVQCTDCDNKIHVKGESLEVNTSSNEREMGDEITHVYSGEAECDKCNGKLRYTIRAYEYPEGALNYVDYHDVENCSFIDKPVITAHVS